ncbi:hypothetical protein Q9189_002350, partial [Teloschistes chrysophthalmus]
KVSVPIPDQDLREILSYNLNVIDPANSPDHLPAPTFPPGLRILFDPSLSPRKPHAPQPAFENNCERGHNDAQDRYQALTGIPQKT